MANVDTQTARAALRRVTIDAAGIPADVRTRAVARWDTSDPDKSVRLPDVQAPATFAWVFEDLAGARSWISAGAALADLFPVLEEGADAGDVVGTLAKVDPRTGEFKWGGPASPREVRAYELAAWRAAGLVAAAPAGMEVSR
ncbi:MAG: hypothetical protein ACYS9X_32005 [Planctomycetota bacterium]